MTRSYYYVPADMAILPMSDGSVLFRSDGLAVKLEGESVKYVVEQIFPLLDGRTALEDVAERKNIEAGQLKLHLDGLVKSGVLRESHTPANERPAGATAFANLLEKLQLDPAKTAEYLKGINVAIAGLEGAGALLAMQLLQAGIGNVTLIDPFPLRQEELVLFPFLDQTAAGRPRQAVFKAYFESVFTGRHLRLAPEHLTKDAVYSLVEGANFLAGCFDKGFVSVHHWLNQAAIEKNIPAIFSEIENHLCRVGPLVLPNETACFMCYRMRDIACADNFAEAMGYETFLNNQKSPLLYTRGFLPASVNLMAGMLANEIIKVLLAWEATLSSRVLEFNVLSLDLQKHYVLQKPDCPVCYKKKAWERKHPSLSTLKSTAQTGGDIHAHKEKLVSAKTGVIKYFDPVQKSPDEPAIPITFGVTLSNHRFFTKEQGDNETCSGKGTNLRAAEISALGEGVERYSGGCFRKDEVHFCSYDEIGRTKLHPERLVLYTPEQYAGLPFARFDAKATMGWSTAYSLVRDSGTEVPSLAVFMNYPVAAPEERICDVSSNGLAAGPTLLQAVLAAALEVIERDAFLIAWYNELPCERIDPLTHPQKEIVDYCRSYGRRGVELQLYRLPTDFPVHVFMGVGYQAGEKDGPALVVGLGASFDAATAAGGALLEIGQVRPALKQRLKTPETQQRMQELLANPSLVNSLDDHSLLYAGNRSVHAFDFLFSRPTVAFDWQRNHQSDSERLQTLVDFLARQQSDFIYYNLTPPDMEQLGLYTARVIIPDMQPIHFGEKNIRLGGSRLYHLPVRLGLRNGARRPDEVNKNPHPLA